MDMKHNGLIVGLSMALCLLVPAGTRAWNPYDTDSARQSGYGYSQDYGSPGYYGTPARPPEWEAGADPRSGVDQPRRADPWADSNWYATDPRRSEQAWRAPSAPADDWGYDSGEGPDRRGFDSGYRQEPPYGAEPAPSAPAGDYGYDDGEGPGRRGWDSGYRQVPGYGHEPVPSATAGPHRDGGWDGWARDGAGTGPGDYRQPRDDSGWGLPARRQYRFREDPELDALSGGAQGAGGYRYRPLTEREEQRQAAQPRFPQVRPSDLQPRGPWRSYEDEGTAFGYHPEAELYERNYRRQR
jgi:hypothetical protein